MLRIRLCGSIGEESACNAGDSGSIPGLGRSPGEGNAVSYPPPPLRDCYRIIWDGDHYRIIWGGVAVNIETSTITSEVFWGGKYISSSIGHNVSLENDLILPVSHSQCLTLSTI